MKISDNFVKGGVLLFEPLLVHLATKFPKVAIRTNLTFFFIPLVKKAEFYVDFDPMKQLLKSHQKII
jgi:hypothetical protein